MQWKTTTDSDASSPTIQTGIQTETDGYRLSIERENMRFKVECRILIIPVSLIHGGGGWNNTVIIEFYFQSCRIYSNIIGITLALDYVYYCSLEIILHFAKQDTVR